MLADELDYVVGVDTHRDGHALAVVAAPSGGVVAQRSVPTSARGYAEAVRFADEFGPGARAWAVEGAGHYGAGLVRYLSRIGEAVFESGRGPRNERRLRGRLREFRLAAEQAGKGWREFDISPGSAPGWRSSPGSSVSPSVRGRSPRSRSSRIISQRPSGAS